MKHIAGLDAEIAIRLLMRRLRIKRDEALLSGSARIKRILSEPLAGLFYALRRIKRFLLWHSSAWL